MPKSKRRRRRRIFVTKHEQVTQISEVCKEGVLEQGELDVNFPSKNGNTNNDVQECNFKDHFHLKLLPYRAQEMIPKQCSRLNF